MGLDGYLCYYNDLRLIEMRVHSGQLTVPVLFWRRVCPSENGSGPYITPSIFLDVASVRGRSELSSEHLLLGFKSQLTSVLLLELRLLL